MNMVTSINVCKCLSLFCMLTFCLFYTSSSMAGFVDQNDKLVDMIETLKDDPSALSKQDKIQILNQTEDALNELSYHIQSKFSQPINEWCDNLIRLFTLFNLPESDTYEVKEKILAIKEWSESTKKLASKLSLDEVKSTEISSEDDIVITFSGSGTKTTRPFTVSNGWEIQWEYDAGNQFDGIGHFSIILHNESGEIVDFVANQISSGSSSFYHPQGGKYYLEINSVPGNYRVKIKQVN